MTADNSTGPEFGSRAAADGAWVAGAIGPTGEGLGVMSDDKQAEVQAAYAEQGIHALVAEGVDALVLETFNHLREMQIALGDARDAFDGPIVAQMSFQEDGLLMDGTAPARVADLLATWGADVVGVNCGEGPAVVHDMAAAMLQAGRPVSAQPNAGRPRRLDQRTLYMTTAEYFGVYARRMLKAGVRIAGGCCGTRPEHMAAIGAAARMFGGVDVINIADGPRAMVRMSNTAPALTMQRELDTEIILHVCCRDRNLLGLQSDILGAHVLGLRNLVIITGDPPKFGDYPKATTVFDLDSVELLKLVDGLNKGIDPTGKLVREATEFFLATGAEPAAIDYERELRRLELKIAAGAELVMTQPVYDLYVMPQLGRYGTALDVLQPVSLGASPPDPRSAGGH